MLTYAILRRVTLYYAELRYITLTYARFTLDYAELH